MRIAIFNDYQLPLPATQGGSVPTLTNFILDENEIYHDFDIKVNYYQRFKNIIGDCVNENL